MFVNRKFQSWICANIILEYDLVNEFKIFKVSHPKIKSMYRLANLFLIHKKMRYKHCENPISGINCESLLEYYNA